MKNTLLLLATLGGQSAAQTLYTASYAGSVYSLGLGKANGTLALSTQSQSTECGASPSWLMLDGANEILYCLNEAIGASNGSITSFNTHGNGSLDVIHNLTVPAGPVMSAMYSAPGVHDHQFFAVAHYETSTVTTYAVDPIRGHFKLLQTFTYNMSAPGPNAARQDAPHPHGVTVDPTGRFVLVPDLGADLVRIYYINPVTGHLKPIDPYVAAPGSGPRHGTFWTPKGSSSTDTNVYFFLVHELDNLLSGFRVSYTERGIHFSKFFEESSFGNATATAPSGSKVAEIAISPENNHIVVSNRLDNTFGQKNDSIAVFSCADASGTSFTGVQFLGLYPAYGSSVRGFDISGKLGLIGIALEGSQKVAVALWNKATGRPGKLLAEKAFDGDIPAVAWEL
ncbi:unnamed protein product [Penicillium salamii]|uniref:Uncharacterized protein n=1 Tax=Penicillium salamii TaxID=1612424 RepID=A0A9W4JFA4_9EURO|nr:unnamed protein product [Penicillium salamii]CAG7975523.1 unnamed protein product [Penicillium salamii]CAG8033591.1 unnamed protein product [Penicillium salamii]CAG8058222.1 unnamed protein product [Penicillium salamii]CAG8101853.1 unnamed protein product [Penicillium salamii]